VSGQKTTVPWRFSEWLRAEVRRADGDCVMRPKRVFTSRAKSAQSTQRMIHTENGTYGFFETGKDPGPIWLSQPKP